MLGVVWGIRLLGRAGVQVGSGTHQNWQLGLQAVGTTASEGEKGHCVSVDRCALGRSRAVLLSDPEGFF